MNCNDCHDVYPRILRPRGVAFGESVPSPERVNDGSCRHNCDFALLQPLAKPVVVSPILICLLKVIKNASCAFIDLAQDETRVAGRSRVEIRRVRALLLLGDVVAQQSFLPGTVVRRLHPKPVALEEAVTLRRLIGRGNDESVS